MDGEGKREAEEAEIKTPEVLQNRNTSGGKFIILEFRIDEKMIRTFIFYLFTIDIMTIKICQAFGKIELLF